MYGGSGKLGRGGGGGGGGRGGAGKRNVHTAFHPAPLNRSTAAPGGRLSVGSGAGPRNRKVVSGPTVSAPPAAEETFSLVTGNPLDFAMIIKLAPDLVEEIKRVEAQGGTARIKFDSNPSGNVIDVGGKDFRFTWSREMGDLCDIYEERRSGEDGNGLLVESGCAWRKLNVQRILDESTKNHVKMRSEEAERLKQRKPIVLEHGNPSVKSQMKALAEAEAPQWKNFNHKKEAAFKKRRVDPPAAVGGLSKSVSKPMLSSTTPAKGSHSLSPLKSPPEHPGAPASPFQAGNHTKGPSSVEDIAHLHGTSKENVTSSVGAKTLDLQSILISLLKDNPKGMTLKALEKAIGDAIPHSARKIEPIIKKIATFQAPGRYFLKPGVELENVKKSSSESGSHPQSNCYQKHAPEDNYDQVPAPKLDSAGEAAASELDKETELNSKSGEEINSSDKIDILDHSPDLFGDKKVSDNSEGPAGSSSDSGSDSESDSDSSDSGSDSGSHSRSRSKSRSPLGSGTGSSSDSDSDASSNSKEGSDEDVNIMTSDDEKDTKHKVQASERGFSTSPVPRTSAGGPLQNEIDEKQDEHGSDLVEIEKDLPDDDQVTEMAVVTNSTPNEEGEKAIEECKPSSSESHENQESQVYTVNVFTEREKTAKDGFKHEESDSNDKMSKGKSKRGSNAKHFDEKSERAKRLKSGDSRQPQISQDRDSLFSESPHRLCPDRLIEEPYKGLSTQMKNRATRDGNSDSGLQKGYNQAVPRKSNFDSQQSDRRSVDLNARLKAPNTVEKPGKQAESLGQGIKYPERNLHAHEGLPNQKDKVYREKRYVDDYPNDTNLPGISKEDGVGDKHATPIDSHYMKHSELVGKFKDAEPVSNLRMGDSNRINVDRSPVTSGRGGILQRELSDLELGEFREPLPEETPEVNRQFEKRNSFKKSENKPSTSDYWNLESSKGKPAGKTNVDSRRQSPARLRVGVPANPECSVTEGTPEHHTGDRTRLQSRAMQTLSQHMPRVDRTEVGSQFNKIADESSKTRHDETGVSQKNALERCKDSLKKDAVNAPHQHDTKRRVVPPTMKGSKNQKSSTLGDSNNGRKDTSLAESNDGGQKTRDSSSDENNSFSKYEKEEPELKGPIKDFSQYKEYVHEYREKYNSYCTLNKILEAYRSEFQKFGRDLESAKERDMERYNSILEQLKESYRRCGTEHKYLKKIFIVLHEELKHLKQMIKDFAASYARN